jgi:peptidoglycan LD-endopeptidase LytH
MPQRAKFLSCAMEELKQLVADSNPFPLMGERLHKGNTLALDFTANNQALITIDLKDTATFDAFVFRQLSDAGCKYGIGGYFEKRAIYSRSAVFATQEQDFREFHLGIDIWVEAGAPIHAPIAGKVHSFQDNAGFGNYGPTVILEHDIAGVQFYTLYGHLKLSDLKDLKEGEEIKKGEIFCHVGPFPENGDWPPHLHFQMMLDIGDMKGDFPGVCSAKDKAYYETICPDPNIFIGYE